MAGGGKEVQAAVGTKEQLANQMKVYNAFIKSGFSEAQSKALTAEVGRENSYNAAALYGTHGDPYNKATNMGMLSWQGDRKTKLMAFMKAKGLLGADGKMIQGDESLQAQAEFIKQEIMSNPAYAKTKTGFLQNTNIDPETAAQILGKNYIRWRVDDPVYESGNINRRQFAKMLDKQRLSTPTPSAAQTAMTKEELTPVEAKGKTTVTTPAAVTQESPETLLASLNTKMDQLVKYMAQTTTNTYQQVQATKGLSNDVFRAI